MKVLFLYQDACFHDYWAWIHPSSCAMLFWWIKQSSAKSHNHCFLSPSQCLAAPANNSIDKQSGKKPQHFKGVGKITKKHFILAPKEVGKVTIAIRKDRQKLGQGLAQLDSRRCVSNGKNDKYNWRHDTRLGRELVQAHLSKREAVGLGLPLVPNCVSQTFTVCNVSGGVC